MHTRVAVALLALIPFGSTVAQQITSEEYAQRRRALLDRFTDGIVLLHARSGPKEEDQPGFIQDASFYYFTGLPNQPGAILALDGPRREVRLFVSPPPLAFGFPVADLVLPPGTASANRHGLDAVQTWAEFVPYVKQRVAAGVRRLYVDESRRPEMVGTPDDLWPVAGALTLWKRSLAHAFPEVSIGSARSAIQALRWVKSPAEVALLRGNARATAAALLAGVARIEPGITQREAEVAVVSGCVEAGAEGPSFWPWMMAGPNGHARRLVRAFYDYEHLNRTMQVGELVRVDVGCGGHGYGGDVGRTVPVGGHFTAEQREIWDLLIAGYRAGMQVMRPGVTRADISEASTAEVRRRATSLRTAPGREAASFLLSDRGRSIWSIHGVGVASGETPLDTLAEGTVIAFEPMMAVGADAYYLEDMIAITADGFEVLSAGLPYTADEIEHVMRR